MTHSVTVRVGWPREDLWNNSRAHFMAKARAIKGARQAAYYAAVAAGVRRLPMCDSYTINCSFTPPRKPGPARDMLNCRDALKASFDGIASAMGVDDRIFRPGADTFHLKSGAGHVDIEVIPAVVMIEVRGTIS